MEWTQVLATIGSGAFLGTVASRVLDVFANAHRDRLAHQHEHRRWLRERRVEAFNGLAKELLTFGTLWERGDQRYDYLQALGAVGGAILLVEDGAAAARIEEFMNDVGTAHELQAELERAPSPALEQQRDALLDKLEGDSEALIRELRAALVEPPPYGVLPRRSLSERLRAWLSPRGSLTVERIGAQGG